MRNGAEDAQPPPRLRGASLLLRVWVMVQGAPRGLSESVLKAVLNFGQIRGSAASSPSVPPHSTTCLPEVRPYPPERPSSPLARSLALLWKSLVLHTWVVSPRWVGWGWRCVKRVGGEC